MRSQCHLLRCLQDEVMHQRYWRVRHRLSQRWLTECCVCRATTWRPAQRCDTRRTSSPVSCCACTRMPGYPSALPCPTSSRTATAALAWCEASPSHSRPPSAPLPLIFVCLCLLLKYGKLCQDAVVRLACPGPRHRELGSTLLYVLCFYVTAVGLCADCWGRPGASRE